MAKQRSNPKQDAFHRFLARMEQKDSLFTMEDIATNTGSPFIRICNTDAGKSPILAFAQYGLPHCMTPFSQNSIKGRVAETIIQELFLAHDFNVFHYGMERSIPGIAQLTRKTNGPVNDRIRSMPDFVVQDPRNHRLHFVEVKYRANGQFSIDDIKGEYPWPHAFFIVVSKEHIKCLTYKQLAAGMAIAPECNNLLIKRKDLDLDRTLIVEYGQMAKRFFAGV